MAITNTEPLSQITGVTPYEKYIEPTRKPLQESSKAKAEIGGLKQSMEADRTAQKVKDVGAVEEQFSKQVSEAPEIAEKKRVSESMEKPFIPTQENAKDMATLFSLINVIGFAMGAGGKRNAQGAMSAMNGMLEGHRAGRDDVYKREKTAFDTNLKQLKMRYDTLDNQLKDALNTYKTDKEAGLRKAEMAYAEAGASFYKQYQDKFGLAGMYEFHKQAYDSANKVYTELKREEDRAERLRQAAEREKRAERREDRADTRLSASLAAKAAGGGRAEKPPTRKETLPLIQGIRGVEKLQQDLRDPEVQSGLIAKTAPLLEKIKSLNPNEDFSTAVNNTLTSTDKTTVFLKNALLNSYAIERASSGGGRLTVAMMRQAGPVLDPTNYTPQAYNQVLEDRRREFYENLQDYGFTPDQIKESTASRAYQPFGSTQPSPAAAPSQDYSADAQKRFGAYEPNKYNYGYENGKFYRESK
jgi:hypothetical protein